MTEEEKEAIERLKEALKDIKDYLNSSNNTEEGIKLSTAIKVTSLGAAIENVLYLVEKKTDELIKTYNEEIKDNYISKGEIRKLDNECFPRYEVGFFKGQRIMGTNECTYFAEKMLELLEEE